MLECLNISSLTCKCVIFKLELNTKGGQREIEF